MPATEAERCGKPAFVVTQEKRTRMTADLQATVLQRAELEGTGQRERAAGYKPLVVLQPRRTVDGRVNHRVAGEREPPEARPNERVAAEEYRDGRA
jgi:hypothetical protein